MKNLLGMMEIPYIGRYGGHKWQRYLDQGFGCTRSILSRYGIFGLSRISSKHTMLTGTRINIQHQSIISISLHTVSLVDQTFLLVERLALEISNYEVPHSFTLLTVVLC